MQLQSMGNVTCTLKTGGQKRKEKERKKNKRKEKKRIKKS